MNQEMLSAVLDGECTPGELDRFLDDCERSPELARRWGRLWLTREARNGVRITREQGCICAGVMSALDAPPSVEPGKPKVIPLPPAAPQRAVSHRPAVRRWAPLAGLAAAASVVGFALVAVLNLQAPPETLSPTLAPDVAQLQPASDSTGRAAPRAISVSGGEPREARLLWANASEEDLQQLDDYLIDHSNLRSASSFAGRLGYARFAAYTADYRPADPAGDDR